MACQQGELVDIRNHRAAPHLVSLMGTSFFVWHAYPVLWLHQGWVSVAPTFDRMTCEEHGFPLVTFDGHTDALLPAVDPLGRRFVEYVNHRGLFDDVPLGEVILGWREAYGNTRVDTWIAALSSA